MIDDVKVLTERLLKSLLLSVAGSKQNSEDSIDYNALRDILVLLIEKFGKSKDDVIQILGREIGFAIAAVLKEPAGQLVESKRLVVSIELEPKRNNSDTEDEACDEETEGNKKPDEKATRKKTSTKKKDSTKKKAKAADK